MVTTTNPYLANLPRGAGLVSNSIGSVGQPMVLPAGSGAARYGNALPAGVAGPERADPLTTAFTPSWFDPAHGSPLSQAITAGQQAMQQGATMDDLQRIARDEYGITGGGWDAVRMGLQGPTPTGAAARPGGAGAMGGGNPYLDGMAQAMQNQVNQNLQFNVLPSMRSQFIGAGGYGGSRQGIAEGVASGLASQGLAGSIAGLYGGAYESDQNRQMQRQQMDMQDRQFGQQFGLNSNIAANNATLGLYDRMLQGAGTAVGAATDVQNTPMNYYQQFLNSANAAGGQGGSTTQPFFGNPFLGALGGWQLGSSLFGGNKP